MRQINLVNLALLPPKPFFQFRSMVLALGVLALGLCVLALLVRPRLVQYEAAATASQARLDAKLAQLKQQELALQPRLADPQVAATLAALRVEQQGLQRVESLLQAGTGDGAGRRASDYLYALSAQALPGVWLTGVDVTGADVSLQGLALNVAAVPATLALLKQLPAFEGLRFSAFEMGRQSLVATDAAKPVEALGFRLDSAAAKGPAR